ncbi:MAG: threonine synthase [Candidatus Marinimicrobia bacterium]|nr:threonine synthase [Candidatus Neomarinimicrobiota bacterium]
MKFYSTADKSNIVSLREAVLGGMPKDKGLYMPESIPRLPESFFESMATLDYQSLSFEVARQFLDNDIPAAILQDIINEAINFETPVLDIENRIKTLELFHGPTLAFKDVGARFMSRLMAYLIKDSDHKLTILVATSGDTGSAVANGFYRIPGIDVIVLYPDGKISLIQEKQIATLGENITALKVAGNFDDCQRLVKAALVDPDIKKSLMLTSANSINISRLIPQSFYYFNAFRQIDNFRSISIVVSVPSGNFGNLTAGLIAKRMGLPIQRFIASTNINHIVPDYLENGRFEPKPSIQTISNAMDVGNPSNFARILDLYATSWTDIRRAIWGTYFSDDETRQAISSVKKSCGYILDPHGAVGYLGLKKYLTQHRNVDIGVFLETAHPAKFKDIVEPVIQDTVEIPKRLADFLNRKLQSQNLSNRYEDFKEFLLSNSD